MDDIKCGNHPKRKYDCTDLQIKRDLQPVTRQKLKNSQHHWYLAEDYLFYQPFLVRVIDINDSQMEFAFLNSETGEDLESLSSKTYKIAYNNAKYAWANPPSTAHLVLPNDLQSKEPQSCGLLFIEHKYMVSGALVSKDDYDAITSVGGGDGKWPISAGELAKQPEMAGHIRQLDVDLQKVPTEYRASLEVTLNKLKALV